MKPDAAEVSDDAFLDGRVVVSQPRHGHRAGIDAVFLAAAVPAADGDRVLEAGSGTGIVALLIAHHVAGALLTGVEIEPELVALARSNAARNGCSERVRFIAADVTAAHAMLAAAGVVADSFDHVIANPPFFGADEGTASPRALKRRAGVIAPGGLDDWARFLAAMARPGGSATLIHRAAALPELLAVLDGRFGGIAVYPLFPRTGEAASRVLVQGRKGSRAPLRLLPGMVLHEDDGNGFRAEAKAVLALGARIDLGA